MENVPGYGRPGGIKSRRNIPVENRDMETFQDLEASTSHAVHGKTVGVRKRLYQQVYKLYYHVLHKQMLVPDHITLMVRHVANEFSEQFTDLHT